MGFIEETGVAQLYRDARITPIYEGTTGIQANDLVGRKIARDGGRAAQGLIEDMRKLGQAIAKEPSFGGAGRVFSAAIDALESAVQYVVSSYGRDMRGVSAGAVPLLELFGVVAGGWQLLRSALVARDRLASPPAQGAASAAFYRAKIETARFYADHVLSQAPGLAHAIIEGSAGVLAEGAL
jgi:acyl-CoA dehydrogenase